MWVFKNGGGFNKVKLTVMNNKDKIQIPAVDMDFA